MPDECREVLATTYPGWPGRIGAGQAFQYTQCLECGRYLSLIVNMYEDLSSVTHRCPFCKTRETETGFTVCTRSMAASFWSPSPHFNPFFGDTYRFVTVPRFPETFFCVVYITPQTALSAVLAHLHLEAPPVEGRIVEVYCLEREDYVAPPEGEY